MIVRDPRASWSFVLERDRDQPKEKQTVFRLKHLTLAQEHAIVDQVGRDPISGMTVRHAAGTEHLRTLRHGLVGWANLKRVDGTDVQFEASPLGGATDELLFLLPLGVREELATAIEMELAWNEDESGKSGSPPTPATAAS